MTTEHPPALQRLPSAPWPVSELRTPPPAAEAPVPALTLYQVPVPGAVEVHLPDGRTAWARPTPERLAPLPADTAGGGEPVPGWAKAVCLVAGSLTALALGSAAALRIAAPTLGDLVDLLDTLWKVALTLTVILVGATAAGRALLGKTSRTHGDTEQTSPGESGQPMVFAPHIDTGGTRLIGRGGDITIQLGDRNRAMH